MLPFVWWDIDPFRLVTLKQDLEHIAFGVEHLDLSQLNFGRNANVVWNIQFAKLIENFTGPDLNGVNSG